MNVKICLNMIVKDESKIIGRCLNSVVGIIDALIISDTGSKDNTIDIIENWKNKNDKYGYVTKHKWKNFSHNRNLILEGAKNWIHNRNNNNTVWYILFIDADDFLVIEDLKLFKTQLKTLSYDKYLINGKCNNVIYARNFLIKIQDKNWRWESILHEYITCNDKLSIGKVNNCYLQISRDGNRSSDLMKYFKDVLILEEALKSEPNNTRYTFYLAQSYRDCKENRFYKMAETIYIKRSNMEGGIEERYISLIEAAKCRTYRGKRDFKMINYLQRALCLKSDRLEAPYYLINYYRTQKLYRIGYNIGLPLINIPFPKDVLFVDKDIHTWKFLDELAICACWIGDIKTFKDIYTKLLNIVPNNVKPRIEKDLINFGEK